MTVQSKAPGGGENRSGAHQDSTTTFKVRRSRKAGHSGHRPKRRPRGDWSLYEMAKASWEAAHPHATYLERDCAMRSIARRCGV